MKKKDRPYKEPSPAAMKRLAIKSRVANERQNLCSVCGAYTSPGALALERTHYALLCKSCNGKRAAAAKLAKKNAKLKQTSLFPDGS